MMICLLVAVPVGCVDFLWGEVEDLHIYHISVFRISVESWIYLF